MHVVTPLTTTLHAAFPRPALITCLLDELIETIKAEAAIKGISLPASRAAIAGMAFEVDSLIVVSILCAAETIVGLEISEGVVRVGGYGSAQDALDELLPRIEAIWVKSHRAKP